MPDKNDTPAREQLDKLVKRADHLSNFGTLTSLISTAAYFIENTFVKKLPKWFSVATLSAVGVGIISVITSYYYKLKAARIVLDSSAQNRTDAAYPPEVTGVLPESALVPGENRKAKQKWAREIGSTQDSPSEPGR